MANKRKSADQKVDVIAYRTNYNRKNYKRVTINLKQDTAALLEEYVKKEYPEYSLSNYIKLLICRDLAGNADIADFANIAYYMFGDIEIPEEILQSLQTRSEEKEPNKSTT